MFSSSLSGFHPRKCFLACNQHSSCVKYTGLVLKSSGRAEKKSSYGLQCGSLPMWIHRLGVEELWECRKEEFLWPPMSFHYQCGWFLKCHMPMVSWLHLQKPIFHLFANDWTWWHSWMGDEAHICWIILLAIRIKTFKITFGQVMASENII